MSPALCPPCPAAPPPCRRRGFTLVELMMVIVIIAILAGLVLTVTVKVKKAAQQASTSAFMAKLGAGIQSYQSDYHAFPGPLANNQLGNSYAVGSDASGLPYSYPAYIGSGNNPILLVGTGAGSALDVAHITGSHNLILGLCGGLRVVNINGTVTFEYHPEDIFPDGATPNPRGPASLNLNTPKRQQPYVNVTAGELTIPHYDSSGKLQPFIDYANRSPSATIIPEPLDKFSNPLPILYVRCNTGGSAVVGIRATDGSKQLQDGVTSDGSPNYIRAQYDLAQVLDYTLPKNNSRMGISNAADMNSVHGLAGVGTTFNPIQAPSTGYAANGGANALAYLHDPSFKADQTTGVPSWDTSATNVHNGMPRGKDSYILISAGPDGIYGTNDDIIYPGSLLGQ